MKIRSEPLSILRRTLHLGGGFVKNVPPAMLALWLFCPITGFGAERERVAPATETSGEEDLLARPLDAVWKHYSEDPQTKLSDVWHVQDGVLVCRGTPKGYLYLDRNLTSFVLRLEWRWPPGKKPGNGGVLIRTTGPDQIWPRSLEAQLNAGQAGDFWGLAGYSLHGPADRRKTMEQTQFGRLTNLRRADDLENPAGAWNRYEIIAEGAEVTLLVNGQEANRATGCEVVPGRICLTAEGNEIHFRNVRLIRRED